jgi:glycosyltransferase involved in cell wall biosynthesis
MSVPPTRDLGASIIIPSYESHGTIAAMLQSLRNQIFRDFEVIVIDSGPSNAVAEIAANFPEVHYHRATERLLPHEARNLGVSLARSDLLVFTDPDVVVAPDWLEKLIATYRVTNRPVSGAVASLQRDWLKIGIHLAKFDLWLPGGPARDVAIGPTVNFLCPRRLFEKAGGFNGREMIGDTLLSWELVRLRHPPRFCPDAIVYHDHRSTFPQLLGERFARGADFARLRMATADWDVGRTLITLCASVLPLRLAKLVARSVGCSAQAGCLRDGLRTLPVIVSGHAAWLAGEVSQYGRRLVATKKERAFACVS